jgi:cell division protein FtsN
MGDDFDLFPKRENLDPFSFGKKEKNAESDNADSGDELFGQKGQVPGPLPDLPADLSPDLPPDLPGEPPVVPPQLPDLPLGESASEVSPPASGMPHLEPPPSPTLPVPDTVPDSMDGILSDGPISEEKTFDEPVFEQEQVLEDPSERSSRKAPSPFIVIGGALIIIIGLLYGALTYLKRDKALVPVVSTPPVSVAVAPLKPEPVPVPEPETAVVQVPSEPSPQPEPEPAVESVPQTEPESSFAEATEDEPSPRPAPAVATGAIQYSVQVGAFILDSSVAQLEKKLRGLGYEPFFKKGSTTAMMNMLTVGPFGKIDDARAALSRLKKAGVDSNMRRRNDGGAIINAGSYLLEENATGIMRKIRSLGYPVKLLKREARLPMTFVRVGHYSGMSEATNAKKELNGKGLDGVVVKLQ